MSCEEQQSGVPQGGGAVDDARVRTVDAREILGEKRVLRLELDGEVYTLRLTRNDKLILTK